MCNSHPNLQVVNDLPVRYFSVMWHIALCVSLTKCHLALTHLSLRVGTHSQQASPPFTQWQLRKQADSEEQPQTLSKSIHTKLIISQKYFSKIIFKNYFSRHLWKKHWRPPQCVWTTVTEVRKAMERRHIRIIKSNHWRIKKVVTIFDLFVKPPWRQLL